MPVPARRRKCRRRAGIRAEPLILCPKRHAPRSARAYSVTADDTVQQQCCGFTSPGRDTGAGGRPFRPLLQAADDLNVEVTDLLAERVAVDAEEVGRLDLVSARGGERHAEERLFEFPQHAVI